MTRIENLAPWPCLDRKPAVPWLFTVVAVLGVLAAFVSTSILFPSTAMADETTTPAPLVLILDASGSMWGQIEGENKIVIARRVLGELIDELPAASDVGLVAYGHRRKGDCADIETLSPLGPLDRDAMKSLVDGLDPKGKTPITASVDQALEIVRESGEPATVVLLSDGLETCGGDPCRAVRLAKEEGIPLVMHVVGFDVAGEDQSQLQCMAQAGDGLFLSAENAGELGEALDTAVAMPVDAPNGRLVVHAVADGELQDVAIHVSDEQGKQAAVARTYRKEETNPRSVPLADGVYQVRVLAVGLKGDPVRSFEIEIVDGGVVEKRVDFSTGELWVGVTRNGELSDAVYKVYAAESGDEVASGRTYKKEKTNPANKKLTAGSYDVKIKSVEIEGADWVELASVELGRVEIEPKGKVRLDHAFESGSVSVGAVRGAERIDTVVHVVDPETGKTVAQSRTYKGPPSNPKTFVLSPGSYLLRAKTVGKDRVQMESKITVEAGGSVTHDFDFEN